MRKCLAYILILLVWCIVFLSQCKTLTEEDFGKGRVSWGKYKIDTVVNEVGLKRLYPDVEHSECGLSNDAFMKYARERIDHSRQLQFIVFIEGKPLVGKRCWRRALIFYLR